MRMLSLAIAAAMLTGAPSIGAAAAEKGADKPDKEKRICRRGETTGSRVVQRTCHTQAEWDAIDAEIAASADREMDRIQTMSKSAGSGFDPN